MKDIRVVGVTGCTGRQGRAVVDALLQRGGYAVRGLTRNPDGPAAQELRRLGAEVVRGDFDAPDTLTPAFQGCHAAFLMTDHFSTLDAPRETRQALALFDACRAASVQYVVWSSLDDTRPLAAGKLKPPDGTYPVPHADAKAIAAERLADSGLQYTVLITSGFMDMFVAEMAPQPIMPRWLARLLPGSGDGRLRGSWSIATNVAPDTRLPWVACEDIGHVVAALIAQGPAQWNGRTLCIAGDVLTQPEAAAHLSEVTGGAVEATSVSDAVMLRLMTWLGGVPKRAAQDVVNMLSYFRQFNEPFIRQRDLDTTRQLHPGTLTFRAWAEKHRADIIRVLEEGKGSTFMKGKAVL